MWIFKPIQHLKSKIDVNRGIARYKMMVNGILYARSHHFKSRMHLPIYDQLDFSHLYKMLFEALGDRISTMRSSKPILCKTTLG